MVYHRLTDLDFALEDVPVLPAPRRVLLTTPDHFDVQYVINPHMEGRVGTVDPAAARRQWEALRAAYERLGLAVEVVEGQAGLCDMVFCANQTFPGLDAAGRRVCILSRMRHPSRQREVPAFREWFRANHFEVVEAEHPFEGGGDAIWHPGHGLVWGGVGPRTEAAAYALVADTFDVPVILLPLAGEDFYHLDTCFCPIDEKTVLVYPPALTADGIALIDAVFERVIEVDETDARERLACNAAACLGRTVVLERGCTALNARLAGLYYDVVEVDTGEFLKSGGSVYCMKQWLF